MNSTGANHESHETLGLADYIGTGSHSSAPVRANSESHRALGLEGIIYMNYLSLSLSIPFCE